MKSYENIFKNALNTTCHITLIEVVTKVATKGFS